MIFNKKQYSYGKQSVSWGDIWQVIKVLRSPWLTQGPSVKAFEQALCDYTGAQYAVAVANGTVALQLAVAALELPAGFEGITTPNTFVASANCILQNGGNVVFADIEKATGNIDLEQIKQHISPNTKLIIPVHFAGQSCDMKKIHDLARQHNAFIIEDAAHAIGSLYDGHKVGSCEYADMTIFSFHPVKTITAGEGGAITTNNKELYEKLLILRTIGITRNAEQFTRNDGPWYYEMQYLSTNGRLSDLQAALGLSQLKRLDGMVSRRREIVDFYQTAFAGDERFSFLQEQSYSKAAWHLWPVLLNFDRIKKSKKQIFNECKEAGLHLQVHYIPVHTQPYYQKLGFKFGDFPQTEKYYQSTLSLPLYLSLTNKDLSHIVSLIKQICV